MNKITHISKLARNCERELALGDFDGEHQPNFFIWAADFKPRATVLAEYGVARILGLALKTVHDAAKLAPGSSQRQEQRYRLGLN